jgi:hypothetical protein
MSLIVPPLVVSQSQDLMEIQSKAIHILQRMRSLIQRKTSMQNSHIAENRKLNAEIFSFEDSKFNRIQIPKPVISKPFNTQTFPFLSVFPASTVHKEDISLDARKSTQSFNKDITDDSYNDFQDKSGEEIKENLVTGNAISHVPYRPLPTYPPEIFVNSDAVEFGFVPMNELPQTNSRPISPTTYIASIQNSDVLVIKSTLQLVWNDTQAKTQIQKYSADNKLTKTLTKPGVEAQNKELEYHDIRIGFESSSIATNPKIKSTLELATKLDKQISKSLHNTVLSNIPDIYIRPETIQTDFLRLARTSNKIYLKSGDWRGLLESDLPVQLQRKPINNKKWKYIHS